MSGRQKCGCDVLDSLLEGGFEKDAVTTIYGPAGSGKTNLALLAAIEVAKQKKVVFVDTEGGYSIERLKQLVPDTKKILQNILFLRPTSFAKQTKAFDELAMLAGGKHKIGLIIVDTIGNLYRLEREEDGREFTRELGMQLRCLNEICRKKKIPILVLNQVYSNFNNAGVKMVANDLVSYASKCLIELQAGHYGQRVAILKKHRSIAEEKSARFAIVQEGVIQV